MKRLVLALLLTASFLSGCIGLDLVYIAVVAAQNSVSDLVPARETVLPDELEAAVPAVYKPFVYRSDQECILRAMMVPFDRTWSEQVQEGGDTITLPPEPGKIAGYIAIIYKKECPQKEAEPVLRAGKQGTERQGGLFGSGAEAERTVMRPGNGGSIGRALDSRDMTDTGKKQPEWWPQVVARMTRLAHTDAAVKEALAFSQELFIQSLPDQAEAIRAAVESESQ